ncbi:ribosome maturation factor RimM [Edaphobacter modestus]|uniref:Ribosome maturation factor RimM n=1 Tax=Edaphobacter modestus TaxID=388466 RepID=A0A4Q7Z1S3_9BACT|nr:ribosome maturation factor RimM [Edaphobacter modestus]RZU43485.1 16S rRNA processing protein RimM [Edaphobacter modestus]
MQVDASTWVVLAHLLRPQGRKGELLAELLTDFPDRFVDRKDLFLISSSNAEDQSARPVDITSSWPPVGKNKGRIVLQFAGVDTISAAEAYVGMDVVVPADHRVPLEDESIYISDLVGCIVREETREIGRIGDVQFPAAPDGSRLSNAAPLLVVTTNDGEEVLIPFVKAFVKNLDLTARRLVMSLPAGLVEVNQQG